MEPVPKKLCRLTPNISLPLSKEGSEKLKGTFNGFSVTVTDEEHMQRIVLQGYFGRGNFSRSVPQFNENRNNEIIRNRQFLQRKNWGQYNERGNKVIVVPDSDSDEDYFTNLTPQYEIDKSGLKEHVNLLLEEAFFLCHAIDCLDIYNDGKRLIDFMEIWKLFVASDEYFVQNYVVYYYYRTKNWVVKPGIMFGGDYLLYKQGPPFYHAAYLVIIDILNGDGKATTRRSMDLVKLIGLNRLCETAGKQLVVCQVTWPKLDLPTFEDLEKFTIKEVQIKRCLATQELSTSR